MSIDRFDWDTLRVFRVVAEMSSMSAAAARLGESPPTISRKIDDLEAKLGAVLFTRTTRGVALTGVGRQVLRQVEIMAGAAEALQREAAPTGEVVSGAITLSTSDGIGPYWLAPRLSEFRRANPEIQVRLMVADQAPDLHSGEADIAITFAEPREASVIAHKLGVKHYIGFASQKYIDESGKPESLFEYDRHRCILHQSFVTQIEGWAPRRANFRKLVDLALITNSNTAIVETCASGGGIAVLPSYMARLDSRLVPLDLPEIAPVRFWIWYTERARRLPQGKVLISWIRQLFETPEAIWFSDEFVHPRDYNAKVSELRPSGQYRSNST